MVEGYKLQINYYKLDWKVINYDKNILFDNQIM